MDNQDIDIKKVKSLINSHLYDLEGIKKSKTLMQEVCTFYKDNFGDGDDYHQVRTLVYEYIEIVDYFLKMHTEFSNEEIDNCIDALNSIRFRILKIGKQNTYRENKLKILSSIIKIVKKIWFYIIEFLIIRPISAIIKIIINIISKIGYKRFPIEELRGKTLLVAAPVISHRKINQKSISIIIRIIFDILILLLVLNAFIKINLAIDINLIGTKYYLFFMLISFIFLLLLSARCTYSIYIFLEENSIKRRQDNAYFISLFAFISSLIAIIIPFSSPLIQFFFGVT